MKNEAEDNSVELEDLQSEDAGDETESTKQQSDNENESSDDDDNKALADGGEGGEAQEEKKIKFRKRLQIKDRIFNKSNFTVCVLWHVIPIIVMVYAYLYVGTYIYTLLLSQTNFQRKRTKKTKDTHNNLLRGLFFCYCVCVCVGALWNPYAHTHNLQILILNADTGFNFTSPDFLNSGPISNTTLAQLLELPPSNSIELLPFLLFIHLIPPTHTLVKFLTHYHFRNRCTLFSFCRCPSSAGHNLFAQHSRCI